MNKKEIIATILKYADELDGLGLTDEADGLTNIADQFGKDYKFPEEDPLAFLRDDQLAAEPDELEQMELLKSLGDEGEVDTEFDPSVDDQRAEQQFADLLSDSGADVFANE